MQVNKSCFDKKRKMPVRQVKKPYREQSSFSLLSVLINVSGQPRKKNKIRIGYYS